MISEQDSIEKEIVLFDREVSAQRAELGQLHVTGQTSVGIEKQIFILENRLEKSLTKFNKASLVNKKYRAQIDNMRRERIFFDNLYHKYEREMNEQKRRMSDIIEVSNGAYESR